MKTSVQEQEYRARINRVMDHIESNIDRPLPLRELAQIAHFSPYHFHRIFRAMVGETLAGHVQRLRVEKAASMLVANPGKSITEIAFDVGFSGPASFAKLFRGTFGMSASRWRAGGFRRFQVIRAAQSKNGKTKRNNGKEFVSSHGYLDGFSNAGGADRAEPVEKNKTGRKPKMSIAEKTQVEVKTIPSMTLAYVRHIGPYKGDSALFGKLWSRLMTWAGPRGLTQQPDFKCLTVYHDDPEITDADKLRISVCISVPRDFKVDGEIGKMDVPQGRYAVAHFEISEDEFQQAWDYVYGTWLPGSGYQPDDRPCLEFCLNNPSDHPKRMHIVEIGVPVKPL